jgi:glycine cleavage system H lipoate-binding protein
MWTFETDQLLNPGISFVGRSLWTATANKAIAIESLRHYLARLGAVVLVDPPPVGAFVRQGSEAGVIETTKAVSDLVMPVTGVITNVNPETSVDPGRVSDDPSELQGLWDEAEYLAASGD